MDHALQEFLWQHGVMGEGARPTAKRILGYTAVIELHVSLERASASRMGHHQKYGVLGMCLVCRVARLDASGAIAAPMERACHNGGGSVSRDYWPPLVRAQE